MTYSELQVTTHFSFLRGASSPEDLFQQAALIGLPALGIVDRNSVGGVVRALVAAEKISDLGLKIRMIAGCRLDLVDGSSVLVWPEDVAAWSRLTRLLTLGKSRADAQKGEKGRCFLHWDDLAGAAEGMVGALVPGLADTGDPQALRWMADVFGTNGHVCLTQHRRPGDAMRLHELDLAARRFGLTGLATGDVLYDTPDRRMLQDVVTAIRECCTIDELGFRRERSADRHLKSPQEMARRFRDYPEAIAASAAIAERCTFSLRSLRYQYPDEILMSRHTPQKALERMAWRALNARHEGRPQQAYRHLLTKELNLVQKLGYAPYFLTVLAIVEFARSQHILCQGRGSAANSLVCFLLGVTSIDPVKNQLLFERFVSEERGEPPDIDIDFEHDRREEVIQWIYETYGHDHAALTAVVSRYRSRGALREVGKAMGLPEDVTAALSSQVWGTSNDVDDSHAAALNLDRSDPRLALTLELARQLIGTPRHLSQHPGGFVLTRDRLDTLVPIEPAAMVKRRVVEWEKLDVEELGLMKVDVLGLGMLGCMRRAFALLEEHKGERMTLDADVLQGTDTPTFDMIQQADTLGVFQIESRAQMSMLPRMKPENFYDIAIQVAIVRPGPIQGNMVHPYLKRRQNRNLVEYPSPALKHVLEKTLGVPLFQEQAMQVAIVGAGFTPTEADKLRRAMATFKASGDIGEFGPKLIKGMLERGISQDFAERLVEQIKGFSNYGFPESHAASFALLVTISSWLKNYEPACFLAALLDSQPMGFYSPSQLVQDARRHGVEVRPVDVTKSEMDTTLEARALDAPRMPPGTDARYADRLGNENQPAVRLGLKRISSLSKQGAERLLEARAQAPFTSTEDLALRAELDGKDMAALAAADALMSLSGHRRQQVWDATATRGMGGRAPALLKGVPIHEQALLLPAAPEGEEIVGDYAALGLTLRRHPLALLRPRLARMKLLSAEQLRAQPSGQTVRACGIVKGRQRPGTANGTIFVTLEDETGNVNVIVWSHVIEAWREPLLKSHLLAVQGTWQRDDDSGGKVQHLIATGFKDLTPLMGRLAQSNTSRDFH